MALGICRKGREIKMFVYEKKLREKALPSLLIIRDSFADSLVPFLLKDFSSIHLLDLRYYREPVSEYIKANDIDAVLLLYSTEDFFTDSNLALLTR